MIDGLQLPANLWPLLWRAADGQFDRFIKLCIDNGVVPLLFADDAVPEIIRSQLAPQRALAMLYKRRYELTRNVMRRVAAIVGSDSLLFLKGADYANTLYPDPALRPMNDLDFLVLREHVPEVVARFEAAGFTRKHVHQGAPWVPGFFEMTFEIDEIKVELHRAFFQRYRGAIDYQAVWERRLPLQGDGFQAWRMSETDAMVHPGINFAKDDYIIKLSRLVDVWLMLHQRTALMEAAVERAREWRTEHTFYATLRLVTDLFPDVPPKVQEVMETLATAPLRARIDRLVVRPAPLLPFDSTSRAVALWRKFWLIDSMWRRVAFLSWHGYATLYGHAREFAARRSTAVREAALRN